jgi:deoxyribodipyrimidine photolyase-related protein
VSEAARHLVVVLGDQLDPGSTAFDGFDRRQDRVWMAEVREEAAHVWSHKARIALFLAAMRHFRNALRERLVPIVYHQLGTHPHQGLGEALAADVRRLTPSRVIVAEPGDWRVRETLRAVSRATGVPLEIRADAHFVCSTADYAQWAKGRRIHRLEHFYRWLRARSGILMDGEAPLGGRWNFDADNRAAFGRAGPGLLSAPAAFAPDALTREALADVEKHYPDHPGSLDRFDWPVTPGDAEAALADFVAHRLPLFGRYQDAMWTGEPWLHHSRLSAALNLKLISPHRVVAAAIAALDAGAAPLAAVEGFVRQILGWRELVRGLYWQHMPEWLDQNALGADRALPDFYWTGETDLACLRAVLGQTLEHGYAHHIQRLMVTGLFALLLGVAPRAVHEWYLAVYVDAVEWVELPNTLGMSQYADGGWLASKPYVASGRYIQRMSNYCQGCRYDPAIAVGERACPFTTLYWDFLARHRARFAVHPRAAMQWRNLARLDSTTLEHIRRGAATVRDALTNNCVTTRGSIA